MSTDLVPLLPRQKAPAITVPLVSGGHWALNADAPQNFTLIVFYRGMHCAACRAYLSNLIKLLDEFEERGVDVIAISGDTQERAEKSVTDWNLDGLKVGYGLSSSEARKWGLYISASRGKTSVNIQEPDYFSEPGLFLIRPDGEIYFIAIQTMPFTRPDLASLVGGIDFALAMNYPARGNVERVSSL